MKGKAFYLPTSKGLQSPQAMACKVYKQADISWRLYAHYNCYNSRLHTQHDRMQDLQSFTVEFQVKFSAKWQNPQARVAKSTSKGLQSPQARVCKVHS